MTTKAALYSKVSTADQAIEVIPYGNGHKRAVLYARVSTDDQSEKGYSLPSQFDAMRKYAEREGFVIAGEFQDDYSGATPIEFRPEGAKAYAMLKSGAADLIIAYTIDRFVRPPEDGDEWDMPILIRGLAKLGKEIHTVRRGKLNTNFADLLIALLDARKAGEERRDIRERSMRGKRQKVKSGKVTGTRHPYGYRHIRDEHGKSVTFEINKEEARIVCLIYKWYVHGDEHGKRLSANAIAKRLSEMHVPTPGEIQRGYHRKRGAGIWSACKVLEIIMHEVYAGVWRYGVHIGYTRKTYPINEQVSVGVPAIIDRGTWELAQAQRARNKAFSFRNNKRDYLLRGLIECGCGCAMCGRYYSKHQYYNCNWRANHHSHEKRTCSALAVRADAIEADVWDEILGLFSDRVALRDKLELAQRQESEALDPIREKLQITDDMIKRAEAEVFRVGRALQSADPEGDVYKSVKIDEAQVNAQMAELRAKREKFINQLGSRKMTDDRIGTIMQFADDLAEGIDKADYNKKRYTLETLGVVIKVKEGKYHIDTILGSADGTVSTIKRGGVRIVPSSS